MSSIDDCVVKALAIPGAVGASLIDYPSGTTLGSGGTAPGSDPVELSTAAVDVLDALTRRAPFVSAIPRDVIQDVIVTTAGRYHLIYLLRTPFDSQIAFYLWLDRSLGNLAVARRTMQLLARELVTA